MSPNKNVSKRTVCDPENSRVCCTKKAQNQQRVSAGKAWYLPGP